MAETTIEWTNRTWNPTTGCDLLSPGCDHCYAKTMSHRLMLMGQQRYPRDSSRNKYRNDFALTLHPDTLDLPRTWPKPQMIFVNSMSDLFHHSVSLEYIQRVIKTMRETPQHTYQVLTKRSGRLLAYSEQIDWPSNVWIGVSIESEKYKGRADHLRRTGAKVKFLSLEPLLGPLGVLNLEGIDWVITGGESGHGARPMHPDWARSIRNQCVAAGVAFFFKQWGAWGPFHSGPIKELGNPPLETGGGHSLRDVGGYTMAKFNKKANGALLDGREWKEFPDSKCLPLATESTGSDPDFTRKI